MGILLAILIVITVGYVIDAGIEGCMQVLSAMDDTQLKECITRYKKGI
ncbi:hypothetical protein [Clostridium acidisoli]|nr:hypothetical protein [Clostridium acidisoli]